MHDTRGLVLHSLAFEPSLSFLLHPLIPVLGYYDERRERETGQHRPQMVRSRYAESVVRSTN